MRNNKFIGIYVLSLCFFIIFLPELSKDYIFFKNILKLGIIKVYILLLLFGIIIDLILNKKSSLLFRISKFEIIFLILLLIVFIYAFKHLY
jgi:hypothetical protein